MRIPIYCVLLISLTLPPLFAAQLNAQQWSSFLNGGKPTAESAKIATQWSPETGIAWQTKLAGYGQSSPIVHGETVYTTSVTGANKETLNVEAFSMATGKRAWIHSQPNSTPQANTVMVSRAACSPVADDQGIIAMFEGGNVVALKHDGTIRWQRDLTAEFGDVKARHGLAASLEQNDQHVFVWVERSESPYVMAVNKSDGETVWKVAGLGSTSWGSPRLVAVGETDHLTLSSSGKVVGLDPASGKRLWEFDNIQGNSSTTPIPVGNGKFMIGSTAGRGKTTFTKPCSGVIEIKQTDDGFEAAWLWSSMKLTCSFGSPFAFENRAYFVNRTGIAHCHHVETGERIFAGRLSCGSVWATPLASGGLLYFFGKSGASCVVSPADKLEVLEENRLWSADKPDAAKSDKPEDRFSGAVLYAAATAGQQLLLRRGDTLFAIAKPTENAKPEN